MQCEITTTGVVVVVPGVGVEAEAAEEVEVKTSPPQTPQTRVSQDPDTREPSIRISQLAIGPGAACISNLAAKLSSVRNRRHVHGKTCTLQNLQIIESLTSSAPLNTH